MRCSVIRELDTLEDFLQNKGQLHCSVIQGLDFSQTKIDWERLDFKGAVFLGCHFPKTVSADFLINNGAVIFPQLPDLPYDPYRSNLYTRAELMVGWTPGNDQSTDRKIYDHFVKAGKSNADVLESLAQRLHDHAIDDGMTDLLQGRVDGIAQKKVIGIMGGHGTSRDDPYYAKVVKIARKLTIEGYFIATGGGPGTMEAANLGAWLQYASDDEVDEAISLLSKSPIYTSKGFMEAAQTVLDMHPKGGASIAIPTWFYGHEPTNLFSVYIAKYFSNSIREDGLLAISNHGVIFAPGSAGTTQEIFMDATQNHYVSYGKISPMVFLGEKRYKEDTMLYPCIQQLAEGRAYADYLHCSDSVDELVEFIINHPPLETPGLKPLPTNTIAN